MPKLMRKRVPLPIIGLDVSQPGEFLDSRSTPDCENVCIERSVITKRLGTSAMGSAFSNGERILALPELEVNDQGYLLRIGLTKVELYNKVAETWSSVANTALTGVEDDRVDFAFPLLSGSKILTFTNFRDNIRKYTGSGNDADLGGTPPKCRYMIAYGSYLVLAHIESYPHRVQWSDTGAPETWTGGNTGVQDLLEDADEITGIGVFGDFLTVHKRSAIYNGYLVPSSEIFRFDRKATGVGTCCFATIQNITVTGEQIFLAADGFHLYNGTTAPAIPSSINDEIRDSLNPSELHKCWSVLLHERDEYWCAVPLGDETEPNTIFKYNYRTGQCYKDTRTNISAAGTFENTQGYTWDQKTNTWDSDTTRWNDLIYLSLNEVICFGSTAGVTTKRAAVYNDNGSAVSAYWTSKDYTAQDFGFDDTGILMRWNELQVWAKGSGMDSEYSTDGGTTWTAITTFTLSSDYPTDAAPLFGYFDVTSTRIRFRFSNDTAGESFSLKQFKIKATAREEIR